MSHALFLQHVTQFNCEWRLLFFELCKQRLYFLCFVEAYIDECKRKHQLRIVRVFQQCSFERLSALFKPLCVEVGMAERCLKSAD